MKSYRNYLLLMAFALSFGTMGAAIADEAHDDDKNECPVGNYDQPYTMANGTYIDETHPASTLGLSIDAQFGYGAEAITHCLETRKHAKVLVAINGAHPTNKNGVTQQNKARFLSNIEYMRENYEDVHDMKIGEEVDVVAVASSSGALLMTTHHPAWMRPKAQGSEPGCPMKPIDGMTCANPFQHLVERAQQLGVRFYLCQMASRVLGIKMGNKIPGVQFVPGGHIAVADFQMQGYALIDL